MERLGSAMVSYYSNIGFGAIALGLRSDGWWWGGGDGVCQDDLLFEQSWSSAVVQQYINQYKGVLHRTFCAYRDPRCKTVTFKTWVDFCKVRVRVPRAIGPGLPGNRKKGRVITGNYL